MKRNDIGDERLRRAFAAPQETAERGENCPDDSEIWAASRGDLPDERRDELLAHSIDCAACAASFRMAAELGTQTEVARGKTAPPTRWNVRRLVYAGGAVAAAAIVLMLLTPVGDNGADRFRDPGSATIESRLDESEPLDRSACWLRWSPGPRGTLYTVEALFENLTPLTRVEEIEAAEYRIPEAALESLPSGASFLWRIEALQPDTTRVTSPVFRAVLR